MSERIVSTRVSRGSYEVLLESGHKLQMLTLSPPRSARRHFAVILATWACVTLRPFPPEAVSQEPPPATFSESIDVLLVNVQAVVTDRKDQRVTGLERKDFHLMVDGKEVSITFFGEIRNGVALGVEDPGGSVGVVEGEATAINYLIFVDDYFSRRDHRDLVLESVRQDLTAMQPQDRAAVVAFDGVSLTKLADWTEDRQALAEALDAASQRPAFSRNPVGDLRSQLRRRHAESTADTANIPSSAGEFRRPIEIGDDGGFRGRLDARQPVLARFFARRISDQVELAVLAASLALQEMPAPEGRKVMLLLSGGWPLSPLLHYVGDAGSTLGMVMAAGREEASGHGGRALYAPLTQTANRLGFTVYPVDVPGMNLSSRREDQTHDALQMIAARTGGRALLDEARVHALAAAGEDLSSYYWLAFSPQRKADDRQYDVRVEIDQRGLRVRARQGFLDASPGTATKLTVAGRLRLGNGFSGSEPAPAWQRLEFASPVEPKLEVRVTGAAVQTKKLFELPLEVRIPMDAIAIVPVDGRYQGELEVSIMAMNRRRQVSAQTVETIFIDEAEPPAAGQYWSHAGTLQMSGRPLRIQVGVFDKIGGLLLTSATELSAATTLEPSERLSVELLQAMVGDYRDGQISDRPELTRVSLREETLQISHPIQGSSDLYHLEDLQFAIVHVPGAILTFQRDRQDRIKGFTIRFGEGGSLPFKRIKEAE